VAQEAFLSNWGSQARKGSLELVVMTSLAEREFYGYELVEHLKAQCGLTVSDGTLYAILLRLKNEGFVRHRWEHAETGPARKYYSLTKTGQSALDGMRAVWAEIAGAVERAKHVKERKDV
jgi:PadR family transcriptional regulator PadR